MANALFRTPDPVNEPVKQYAPGSPEKAALKSELERQRAGGVEIPLVIGGKHLTVGTAEPVTSPHDHQRVLAKSFKATPADIDAAIESSVAAQREWSRVAWEDRAAVFLK